MPERIPFVESNWTPLVAFCKAHPPLTLIDFMFMGVAGTNSQPIFSYKHTNTRRYLNLDSRGNCYTYQPTGYVSIPTPDAITHVLS